MKPEAGQWLLWRRNPGATAKKYGVYIHKCLPNGMFFVEVNPSEYELVSEKTLEGYDHEPRCTGWDWVVPEQPQPAIADQPKLVLKPQKKQIRQKTPVPDECDTAVSVTRDFSPEIGIAARKEDPDEWVIQDRVPVRRGIDRINWMENSVDTSREPFDLSIGKMHGYVNRHGKTLHVYCRRRDLPKVEQDKSDAGHDWSYHNQQKPQPKKTMLRLWIDPDCNIHAGLKGDRDLELFYDHETRQFYTEEQT